MSKPASFDREAPKQTVSLTINSDLYAQATRLGMNASKIAEEALAAEVARRHAERVAEEVRVDLEASDAYASKHGSFAALVRDHYGRDGCGSRS